MDQPLLLGLIAAASFGIVATLFILRRQRLTAPPPPESPFAVSTEGEKRCPNCGMGNLWTASTCMACGRPLRG